MAFRAKNQSTCELCKCAIYVGDYKTWNRRTREEYHIECWRKTPQYMEWKAKQEGKTTGALNEKQDQAEANTAMVHDLAEETEITKEIKPVTKESLSDNAALDVLSSALWQRIEPKINHLDGIKEEMEGFKRDIAKTISSKIEKVKAELPKPTVIHIENKQGEVKNLGIQHKLLPRLIQMLEARDHEGHRPNIWLVGPAGTGKSRACVEAFKALGLEWSMTGSIIDTYKLTGHFSPGTGQYISTQFRERWEHSGGMIFDDFDGSDPNAVTEMLPISNGVFPFPDKMVERHKDFCLVLTANTWGLGGTTDYVGRVKQDAAFINRFVQLYWPIDEELELATCPNPEWAKRVQKVRAKVKAKGLKVMVTPRQSYQGAALLAQGLEQDVVESMVLKGSMTDEQWQEVG